MLGCLLVFPSPSQDIIEINLMFTHHRLLPVNFLLQFDLEASHSGISLELFRIKLASYTVRFTFIAFYTEDHEHVCFGSLGHIIVRKMD